MFATLTACGGGGGTGDSGITPTGPIGGGTGNSSEIITYTSGDYYTFKNERTTIKNGVEISKTISYYTYTIKDPQPDGSHQRYETSSVSQIVLDSYNKNNFRFSENYQTSSCTSTDGLDNPTFQMQIGQKWDSKYSKKCIPESAGLPSDFHSTGTITSKDLIKTEAGDFIAYKADRTREQVSLSTSSTSSTLKGSCWYDEKTSIIVMCDQTTFSSPTTAANSDATEFKTKITLIGINAKNHPTKKLSAASFYGKWQVKFSGQQAGQCLADVLPDGDVKGDCSTQFEAFSIAGKITPNGAFDLTGTNGVKFLGNLSTPIESGGTWSANSSNQTLGTWTANHL